MSELDMEALETDGIKDAAISLTVVTATWNAIRAGRGEKLKRCLRSVSQIKTPHEHLVYDGGSTDGTLEILRELKREIPSLRAVSEPDRGIYDALNKGVRDAAGTWFYVIGDDDCIISPENLDSVLRRGEETCAAILATPTRKDDGGVWPVHLRGALCTMPHCHQGLLARTELVRKYGGFDTRFRISAGCDQFLKMHLAGEPCLIDDRIFAEFSVSGLSCSNREEGRNDVASVMIERLGIDESWRDRIKYARLIPLRVALRFVFHRDRFIRLSARHQVCRYLAWRLGMIGERGAPRKGLRFLGHQSKA